MRRAALFAAFARILLAAPAAKAQLHWDASLQAGAQKRFLVERPRGVDDAGVGPVAQLAAHVALLPLVRVGGYFGHDISPLGGDAAARAITFGGLRAKVMSPWPRGAVRAWVFVGFGYAGVYARSYETTFLVPQPSGPAAPVAARVASAGGSFFDLPFGVGASYKLRKPWELVAELGMRVGFGHTGSVYEDPGPQVKTPGRPDDNVLPTGTDRFALGLTVGVLLDL